MKSIVSFFEVVLFILFLVIMNSNLPFVFVFLFECIVFVCIGLVEKFLN